MTAIKKAKLAFLILKLDFKKLLPICLLLSLVLFLNFIFVAFCSKVLFLAIEQPEPIQIKIAAFAIVFLSIFFIINAIFLEKLAIKGVRKNQRICFMLGASGFEIFVMCAWVSIVALIVGVVTGLFFDSVITQFFGHMAFISEISIKEFLISFGTTALTPIFAIFIIAYQNYKRLKGILK